MNNLPILAHFAVHPGEAPAFTVKKSSFLGRDYYVAAKWQDGFCIKVANFCEKSVAEYWIEVESSRWIEALSGMARIAA